jgi:hypothetical protein
MVSGSFRMGLKSTLRWKEPEPAVAAYHWSDACYFEEMIVSDGTKVRGLLAGVRVHPGLASGRL